jgi:hypothetical protein
MAVLVAQDNQLREEPTHSKQHNTPTPESNIRLAVEHTTKTQSTNYVVSSQNLFVKWSLGKK